MNTEDTDNDNKIVDRARFWVGIWIKEVSNWFLLYL